MNDISGSQGSIPEFLTDPQHCTHYVILVHGTFAGPRDGVRQWWQQGDATFAARLTDALRSHARWDGAVWRDVREELHPSEFHWSGANSHEARKAAGASLHRFIREIADRDASARVHLVAHSHGGNVVLRALQLLLHDRVDRAVARGGGDGEVDARRALGVRDAANLIGRVVFLGTPFLHKTWSVSASRRIVEQTLVVLAWELLFVVIGLFFAYAVKCVEWVLSLHAGSPVDWRLSAVLPWQLYVPFVLVGLLIPVLVAADTPRGDTNMYFDVMEAPVPVFPGRALFVHSTFLDEAFLALSVDTLLVWLLRSPLLAYFRGPWFPEPTGRPVGVSPVGMQVETLQALRRFLVSSPRDLMRPLVDWFGRISAPFFARVLSRYVVRILRNKALGVERRELAGANVSVDPIPHRPCFARQEEWCVLDQLLSVPAGANRAPPESTRYAFLRSSEPADDWWARSLFREHLPRTGDARLKLMALTLEEKVKALVAATDLSHAQYYEQPDIIEGIKEYLVSGTSPGEVPDDTQLSVETCT